VTTTDLEEIDLVGLKSLQALTDLEKEGVDETTFGDLIFLNFTTTSVDGREVELVPNGSTIDVT